MAEDAAARGQIASLRARLDAVERMLRPTTGLGAGVSTQFGVVQTPPRQVGFAARTTTTYSTTTGYGWRVDDLVTTGSLPGFAPTNPPRSGNKAFPIGGNQSLPVGTPVWIEPDPSTGGYVITGVGTTGAPDCCTSPATPVPPTVPLPCPPSGGTAEGVVYHCSDGCRYYDPADIDLWVLCMERCQRFAYVPPGTIDRVGIPCFGASVTIPTTFDVTLYNGTGSFAGLTGNTVTATFSSTVPAGWDISFTSGDGTIVVAGRLVICCDTVPPSLRFYGTATSSNPDTRTPDNPYDCGCTTRFAGCLTGGGTDPGTQSYITSPTFGPLAGTIRLNAGCGDFDLALNTASPPSPPPPPPPGGCQITAGQSASLTVPDGPCAGTYTATWAYAGGPHEVHFSNTCGVDLYVVASAAVPCSNLNFQNSSFGVGVVDYNPGPPIVVTWPGGSPGIGCSGDVVMTT